MGDEDVRTLATLPKTGQSRSYGQRDDGALRKGTYWPNPRFTDEQNGTVAWAQVHELVEGINSGIYPNCASGYADWRLPNIIELRSLLDFETPLTEYAQARGISNLNTVGYWSSTSIYHPDGFIFARTVDPGANRVVYATKEGEFQRQHVWPVRGGD